MVFGVMPGTRKTFVGGDKMTPASELRQRIIYLWEMYAESYRTNPIEYAFLKEERRRLKLPLRKIPGYIMDEYPEIEVLRILNRNVVVAYLTAMPVGRLSLVLKEVENLQYDHAFNSVRAYIIDSRWQISHHGEKYYFCGTKPGKARMKCHRGYCYGD